MSIGCESVTKINASKIVNQSCDELLSELSSSEDEYLVTSVADNNHSDLTHTSDDSSTHASSQQSTHSTPHKSTDSDTDSTLTDEDMDQYANGLGLAFKTHRHRLRWHITAQRKADNAMLRCEQCVPNRCFKTVEVLRKHMEVIHETDCALVCVCVVCGKSFRTKKQLLIHSRLYRHRATSD